MKRDMGYQFTGYLAIDDPDVCVAKVLTRIEQEAGRFKGVEYLDFEMRDGCDCADCMDGYTLPIVIVDGEEQC